MIKNGVYKLTKNTAIETLKINLKKDDIFGVSNGVIFLNGNLLSTELQQVVYNWMNNNMNLFKTDNRF